MRKRQYRFKAQLCASHPARYFLPPRASISEGHCSLEEWGTRDGPAPMASAPTHAGCPHGLEAPRSFPASSLPPVPDLTPDLLWLLALICSHLTPCALKWMGQEILQTQTSNSVSFPTSTFAGLHLSGLKAWQDTGQRKPTWRRAPAEGLPRNSQVNRKAFQL